MFLHLVFKRILLFVKRGRRLALKSRLLFLARDTCPAKSLGLIFPIIGVLVLKGLASSPPSSQLTFGRGGFHFGPSQVSNQGSRRELESQGPLPAWACTQLPNTMNKAGQPQPRRSIGFPPEKGRMITRETLTAALERPKEEEGRKKTAFFPNMDKSMTFSQTFASAEQRH